MASIIWFPFSAEIGINPFGLASDLMRLGPVGHIKRSILPGILHHRPSNLVLLHLTFGAHLAPDGKTLMTSGFDLLQNSDVPANVQSYDEWNTAFFLIKATLAQVAPKAVLVFYTGDPDHSPSSHMNVEKVMGPAFHHCQAICTDSSGNRNAQSRSFTFAEICLQRNKRVFTEHAPKEAHWGPLISGSFSYQSALHNMIRDGWASPCPTKPHYLLMKEANEPITLPPDTRFPWLPCLPGWVPPSHPGQN